MKLEDVIDGYDFKARVLPAVINLVPALITIYYCFPSLYETPVQVTGSGLVSIAVVYLSSMLMRYLGLRVQGSLWKSWGGAPSTRFLRWRDSHFSVEQKIRIRKALSNLFNVHLLTEEQEVKNRYNADQIIEKAFLEVKEFLRQHQSATFLDKHNAEYGFARNLYGGRFVFAGSAILGVILCGLFFGKHFWIFNVGVGLNLVLIAIWVPIGWLLLPDMVKRSADTYAERAWLTFLKIVEN